MDMMSCGDATVTTIVASQELTIMGMEAKGINLDNLASKAFDNMTYHTVGVLKIESRENYGHPVFQVHGSEWRFRCR